MTGHEKNLKEIGTITNMAVYVPFLCLQLLKCRALNYKIINLEVRADTFYSLKPGIIILPEDLELIRKMSIFMSVTLLYTPEQITPIEVEYFFNTY